MKNVTNLVLLGFVSKFYQSTTKSVILKNIKIHTNLRCSLEQRKLVCILIVHRVTH